jgi:hypothetical protein
MITMNRAVSSYILEFKDNVYFQTGKTNKKWNYVY